MTDMEHVPDKIDKIKGLVRKGEIVDLGDLAAMLAKPAQYEPAPTVAADMPITETQRTALGLLPERWGSVVPDTVRELTQDELDRLMEERQTANQVNKMTKERVEAIRVTVLNHFNTVDARERQERLDAGEDVPPATLTRDGWIAEKRQVMTKTGKKWSREPASGSKPQISIDRLKALDEEGVLDHADFLAMTTPVRVIDPNKIMLLLSDKPDLVNVIAQALTDTAPPTVALWER